ncbi:MAG TPA: response regulator [Allosphingosinicella sp.]|nr:response regulator [Allosphingosinicella sp.]
MASAAEPHILLVDDERSIRDPLAQYLGKNGFRVTRAADGAEARRLLAAYGFDLILLDVMMPGEDGLVLCAHVRATSGVPVILVTAKAEETERIVGLEIGADDYVTKPFSPRELLARIRSVLRRAGERPSRIRGGGGEAFGFDRWVLRTGERELIDAGGVAVPLSTGEFNLLLALVTHPRRILSRDQLLDLAAGRELAAFERSVDNMVSRLRRKVEADPKHPSIIKTVWGGGYVFAAEVARL